MVERPGLHARLHQTGPIRLDAELEVAPGELLALVGPSGSGKTTVLHGIAGLHRPGAGLVRCGGETWFDNDRSIWRPAHRRRVGMVFQSYALFPHMTALANVAAALDHLPRRARAGRARELLARVRLEGLELRRPAALSGGQQQRVAVARALAREPLVLLLDEPFSAVDMATRQRLYRELAELRTGLAMPVILVTHDIEEASLLASRLAVLHHGRTLQTGTPAEVRRRPASAEVARLVGLRNIFKGEVAGHEPGAGSTFVRWGGLLLEARLQADVPAGSRVDWVVPVADVILHRRDRPSRGEHENPVAGRLSEFIVLGDMVEAALEPTAAPGERVHVALPLHTARRNGLGSGANATVSLLAQGIHLMPSRASDLGPFPTSGT